MNWLERKQRVENTLKTLVFKSHRFEGTNTVVTLAMLASGHILGVGVASCPSGTTFVYERGAVISQEKALTIARQKLWAIENYNASC